MNRLTKFLAGVLISCLAAVSVNAEPVGNAIEAIQASRQGGDIALRIDLKEPLSSPPPGFGVSNPPKVALDFPNTANQLGKNAMEIKEGDLAGLNVVQAGNRTRVVLNLTRQMNYSTRLEGKSVLVLLSPIERVTDLEAQKTTRFTEESLVGQRHAVRDIMFRRGKDGEGRILVDLSDAGTGIDIRQQGTSLIVDFLKTTVPDHLRRKLDVTDFATPVTVVETKTAGDNVRMVITPKGLWEHNAYQSDNQFVIEVKKVVEDPNKLVQGSKVGYQGPRVSINYQNGDVRALLRLMAEELGLNAVISETVTGQTTLVLKDVPADQVIDIIFQQKGLDMRKKGNIIMIAPRDEISTREKLDYESKQQISELEPLQSEQFVLNYHKAIEVAKLLAGEYSKEAGTGTPNKALTMLSKRGSVVADEQSNKLFVSDIPSKLDEIRTFIRAIDVGARQVLIEARIVEATDSFDRDLGVRLGFLSNSTKNYGGSGGGLTVGGGRYSPGGTQTSTNVLGGAQLPDGGGAGTMALSILSADLNRVLNLELAALEKDGQGKVISSPRVVTTNNVKAKIEDGMEIPYITVQASGGSLTYTVNFKPAKLSLEATPQITPEGTVRMELVIKKEEPDWERAVAVLGFLNPPINSAVLQTNVEVENGGTVVIGGVFTQKNDKNIDKVPLLGDIPFLGWAFKFKSELDERRELLVFVTPRVMSDKLRLD